MKIDLKIIIGVFSDPRNFNLIKLFREEVRKHRYYCFNCDAEFEYPTRFDNFYISEKDLKEMRCPYCHHQIDELKGFLRIIRIPIRPFFVFVAYVAIIVFVLNFIVKAF